jgi:hypothetical protein
VLSLSAARAMIKNANNFASQLGSCPSKTLTVGLPLGEDLFARAHVTPSPLIQHHIVVREIVAFGSGFQGPKTPLHTWGHENSRSLLGWSRYQRPGQLYFAFQVWVPVGSKIVFRMSFRLIRFLSRTMF